MKQIFILALMAISFVACKDNHKGHDHPSGQEAKAGPEYTSKYICPMHCEGSGSDSIGVCPKCGMDYVINKEK